MTSIVRGIALLGYNEFAASQGLDARGLLEQAGLRADTPDQHDELITYSRYTALLEQSARHSDNPLFGLQLGLHQGAEVLGSLLYVIQSGKTVGAALKALREYFHVHSSGAVIHLDIQGDNARLSYEVTDGQAASVRHDVELALAVGSHLMQSLLGRRWRPSALLMRHVSSVPSSDYRRLLGINPRFNSDSNAWIFDAALLGAPLSDADEGLQQLVRRHVEDISQLTLQELPGYVQKVLRTMLPSGKATLDDVAQHMMISPRTLQRYLMDENTGFQQLLDKTRQSMSTRYICDTSISLTQLATLLGYGDLSAFSRAFARWNGVSPRVWKRRYLEAQAVNPSGENR
jgi:AraC-like DNA-binding protein